jgi:hypothetical protein
MAVQAVTESRPGYFAPEHTMCMSSCACGPPIAKLSGPPAIRWRTAGGNLEPLADPSRLSACSFRAIRRLGIALRGCRVYIRQVRFVMMVLHGLLRRLVSERPEQRGAVSGPCPWRGNSRSMAVVFIGVLHAGRLIVLVGMLFAMLVIVGGVGRRGVCCRIGISLDCGVETHAVLPITDRLG